MKYSQKNEFIKERWGGLVPLLNFEGGPGVPLLHLEEGPELPLLNFRGSCVPLLNFEGGSEVPGPGVLVPLLHHGMWNIHTVGNE